MATNRIEEYEGIVLSRIPQKEHDAMVRCLGPHGFFSFYARGALKMGSSSSASTQELSSSKFNLTVSAQGALTLKEGKLDRLYVPQGGLDGLLTAQMLLEYASKAVSEEDAEYVHGLLSLALESLQEGRDPFTVAILFLAKALTKAGNALEVHQCVVCGATTDIVAMDYVHGGFLCKDCVHLSQNGPGEVGELKVYSHAFRCPEEDMRRVTFPKSDASRVLADLLHFVHDAQGIRIRSLEPILKY